MKYAATLSMIHVTSSHHTETSSVSRWAMVVLDSFDFGAVHHDVETSTALPADLGRDRVKKSCQIPCRYRPESGHRCAFRVV